MIGVPTPPRHTTPQPPPPPHAPVTPLTDTPMRPHIRKGPDTCCRMFSSFMFWLSLTHGLLSSNSVFLKGPCVVSGASLNNKLDKRRRGQNVFLWITKQELMIRLFSSVVPTYARSMSQPPLSQKEYHIFLALRCTTTTRALTDRREQHYSYRDVEPK